MKEYRKYLQEQLGTISLSDLDDQATDIHNKYVYTRAKDAVAPKAIQELEAFIKMAEERLQNLDGTENERDIKSMKWNIGLLKNIRDLLVGTPEALKREKEREDSIDRWAQSGGTWD